MRPDIPTVSSHARGSSVPRAAICQLHFLAVQRKEAPYHGHGFEADDHLLER